MLEELWGGGMALGGPRARPASRRLSRVAAGVGGKVSCCVTPQERSAAAKCFGDGAVLAHSAALCWSYYSALGRIGNS